MGGSWRGVGPSSGRRSLPPPLACPTRKGPSSGPRPRTAFLAAPLRLSCRTPDCPALGPSLAGPAQGPEPPVECWDGAEQGSVPSLLQNFSTCAQLSCPSSRPPGSGPSPTAVPRGLVLPSLGCPLGARARAGGSLQVRFNRRRHGGARSLPACGNHTPWSAVCAPAFVGRVVLVFSSQADNGKLLFLLRLLWSPSCLPASRPLGPKCRPSFLEKCRTPAPQPVESGLNPGSVVGMFVLSGSAGPSFRPGVCHVGISEIPDEPEGDLAGAAEARRGSTQCLFRCGSALSGGPSSDWSEAPATLKKL